MTTQTSFEHAVLVPADGGHIRGDLAVPAQALGLVIFAHGSGSGRFSPRNRFVAEVLNEAPLATLLLDLLTQREESVDEFTRQHRFDIELLSKRLIKAIEWAHSDQRTGDLPIGLFGASTGAAAALVAAARHPEVAAVVSRGGRPDLAGTALGDVRAPTLLIVGGNDAVVLDLNRAALAEMTQPPTRLEVVPGASHLFEEGQTLTEAASLARDWFVRHLRQPASAAAQNR